MSEHAVRESENMGTVMTNELGVFSIVSQEGGISGEEAAETLLEEVLTYEKDNRYDDFGEYRSVSVGDILTDVVQFYPYFDREVTRRCDQLSAFYVRGDDGTLGVVYYNNNIRRWECQGVLFAKYTKE